MSERPKKLLALLRLARWDLFFALLLQEELASTHDNAGNRVKYSQDANTSLADLLREEKMGGQKGFDDVVADRISRDVTFKDDLDYLDEKADQLSQKKQGTVDKARNVAITGIIELSLISSTRLQKISRR